MVCAVSALVFILAGKSVTILLNTAWNYQELNNDSEDVLLEGRREEENRGGESPAWKGRVVSRGSFEAVLLIVHWPQTAYSA